MTGQLITVVVVCAVIGGVIGVRGGFVYLNRAARLERELEAHSRDEADLQALAIVSEPRACGCQWVPCDRHLDRLWEAIHEDGDAL